MQLETQRDADIMVVRVAEPRLDAAVAVQFKDAMRDAIAGAPGRVVLDLGDVVFLDSSGLGAVIGAMKSLPDGRAMELAALRPAVAKVFTLTHMDRIFTIHDEAPAIRDGAALDARHAG